MGTKVLHASQTVRSHGHGRNVVPKSRPSECSSMPLCLGRVVTVVQSCRENAENGNALPAGKNKEKNKKKNASPRAAPGSVSLEGSWMLPMGV